MSVIYFNVAKIEQLYSLLEFHLNHVKPLIQCNPYYDRYARKQEHSAGTLNLPFEEEKCVVRFIKDILYYAVISNWVAYGVQYNVAIDFKELSEIDFDSAIPKSNTLEILLKELHHLHYNICTNAGNFFMDKKWLIPFENMINALTELRLNEKLKN